MEIWWRGSLYLASQPGLQVCGYSRVKGKGKHAFSAMCCDAGFSEETGHQLRGLAVTGGAAGHCTANPEGGTIDSQKRLEEPQLKSPTAEATLADLTPVTS